MKPKSESWYGEAYYSRSPESDPRGPESGSRRVNRGGCWIDFAEFARSATRMSDAPDHRDDSIGFRVALPVAGDPR